MKKLSVIIDNVVMGIKDSEDVIHESIKENLNHSCVNFKNKNSTMLSLANALAFSKGYLDQQSVLLYLSCDLLRRGEMCNWSSTKYTLGYNTFFTILPLFKKYINSEITKNEFNSIVCNLTRYFESNDIEAIKKLRENI